MNHSAGEWTLESYPCGWDDIAEVHRLQWRRGRDPVGPPRPSVAVRVGLSYIRALGKAATKRIVAARQTGEEFTSPADLTRIPDAIYDFFTPPIMGVSWLEANCP